MHNTKQLLMMCLPIRRKIMSEKPISWSFLKLFAIIFCLGTLTSQSFAEGAYNEITEILQKIMLAHRQYRIVGEAQETIFFPPRAIPTQPVSYFSQPARADLQLIKENFDITLEEGNNVAQREVWSLKLIAKNNISPNWYFTVDKETGLRLAYEQRAQDGRLIAQGYFENIYNLHLRSLPANPNLESRSPQNSRNLTPARLMAARRLLEGNSLPTGFIPIKLERSRIGNRPALRLTAWDGINILALLVYPNAPNIARPFAPREEIIAQASYVRSLRMQFATLTVLAPLPERVLEDWLQTLSSSRLGLINRSKIERFHR